MHTTLNYLRCFYSEFRKVLVTVNIFRTFPYWIACYLRSDLASMAEDLYIHLIKELWNMHGNTTCVDSACIVRQILLRLGRGIYTVLSANWRFFFVFRSPPNISYNTTGSERLLPTIVILINYGDAPETPHKPYGCLAK